MQKSVSNMNRSFIYNTQTQSCQRFFLTYARFAHRIRRILIATEFEELFWSHRNF